MQSLYLASFLGPAQLSVASSMVKQDRTWYLSHVSDIRIERMVERFNCAWVYWAQNSETAKQPSYQVVYHMCLASGRQLCYTLSVERVHCKNF